MSQTAEAAPMFIGHTADCDCSECRRARKFGRAPEAPQVARPDFPLDEGCFYVRGGKTGKKIHRGRPGSSVLACGKWVKHQLVHFIVRQDTASLPESVFCEKCWANVVDGVPTTRRNV